MAKSKLYNNKTWLTKKWQNDRMSPEDIAEICGVTSRTIYSKLKSFGLLRK